MKWPRELSDDVAISENGTKADVMRCRTYVRFEVLTRRAVEFGDSANGPRSEVVQGHCWSASAFEGLIEQAPLLTVVPVLLSAPVSRLETAKRMVRRCIKERVIPTSHGELLRIPTLCNPMQKPCGIFHSAWQSYGDPKCSLKLGGYGAPEEIRTPDPQIPSLVLV